MVQLLYIPLYVLYVALFLRLIFRWKFFNMPEVRKRHLAFFFLLKAAAGLALTLIYTYYYTDQSKADIYRYFNDSKIISSVLFTDPVAWLKIISGIGTFDSGAFKYLHDTWHFTHPAGEIVTSNSFLIRIISLLNYFSGYNIYIDTLLLNFITFISITVLFKALRSYFEEFHQILYWPLFLMPSFLFWSSGLLKEGVIFVGIAIYLSGWMNDSKGRPWQGVLAPVIGLWIVGITKVYVGLILFFCTGLCPVRNPERTPKTGFAIRAIMVAIGAIVAMAGWYFYKDYSLCGMLLEKRNQFVNLALAEHSGSLLDSSPATTDCHYLFNLIPAALVNAIMRPFMWDKGNVFQMLFAAENLFFILSLLYMSVFNFKMPDAKRLWLALFCFVFALLNYLVIGITIPISGAIVHYRIVALPFLFLSVLLITDLEKLKIRVGRLFPFLNEPS